MANLPARRTLAAYRAFIETDVDALLAGHATGDPAPALLSLFARAAAGVPAYATFLAGHGVDPAAVRSLADFQRLPLMTKADYHLVHPLADRCRDGDLSACDMIAVSSGSTGQPAFWPRALPDELAVSWRFEQVFRDSFRAAERATLAVVCFPLGTWVGGLFTTNA